MITTPLVRVARGGTPSENVSRWDAIRDARQAAGWLADQIRRPVGKRVAITVGSRGFAGLADVLRELCGTLRLRGCRPFLVPAMGSHGGGTQTGQRRVLAGLGVSPETVRAPFAPSATAAPIELGRTPEGRSAFCPRAVIDADAVIIYNRVRPHPSFDGGVQSGLLKMVAVGLGGPHGAVEAHRQGAAGLEPAIIDLSRFVTPRLPRPGALAVVEGGGGKLARLEAVTGGWDRLRGLDGECLALARTLQPSLPVDHLDLLLVDYLGKDICGTGMDTRVIGRRRVWDQPEPTRPLVRRLVVFRLSPGAAGNANGVGLADFTTARLARAIDWTSTLANATATTFTQRAALPPAFPSDRQAVEAALATLPLDRPLRVLRIRDTGHLNHLQVSEGLLDEVRAAGYEPAPAPAEPLSFDAAGDLTDLADGSRRTQ